MIIKTIVCLDLEHEDLYGHETDQEEETEHHVAVTKISSPFVQNTPIVHLRIIMIPNKL